MFQEGEESLKKEKPKRKNEKNVKDKKVDVSLKEGHPLRSRKDVAENPPEKTDKSAGVHGVQEHEGFVVASSGQDVGEKRATSENRVGGGRGNDGRESVAGGRGNGGGFEGPTQSADEFGKMLDEVRVKLKEFGVTVDMTNAELAELHKQIGTTITDLQEWGRAMKESADQLRADVNGFIASRGKTNDAEAIGYYNDAITTLNSRLASIENFSMRQAFALEGQNPVSLRVPTTEMFAQRKVVEAEENRVREAVRKSAPDEEQQPRPITEEAVADYMENHRNFYQEYEEDTKDWFQKNLEILESTGLTFEEQAEHFSRVSMAVNHLRLDRQTRGLGENFHNMLETRRNVQRIARVWDLLPPDGISQQAGILKKDLIRDMFALRSKVVGDPNGGERPLITEQFVKLEEMCEGIDVAKARFWNLVRQGHNPANEAKDRFIKINEDIIQSETVRIRDYVHHGGYITNDSGEILLRSGKYKPMNEIHWEKEPDAEGGGFEKRDQPVFADQGIRMLRGEVLLDDGSFKAVNKVATTDKVVLKKSIVTGAINLRAEKDIELQIEKLEQQLWSVTMAGKLWSITGSAAGHEVQINGAGDFFMDRAMNYGRWLYRRGLQQETIGIWMPTYGKYKGNPFDLHMEGYLSGLFGLRSEDKLTEMGLVRGKDYFGHDGIDNDGNPEFKVDKVVKLKGKKFIKMLSDKKEWDKKSEQLNEGFFSNTFIDDFVNEEATRKMFWGPESFFMNPTKEKFAEMVTAWRQVGEWQRRDAWGEILERSLEYMKHDPKAKDTVQETKHFKTLEMYLWIKEATDSMMILENTSNRLYKEYVGGRMPLSDMETSAMRWMQIKTIWDFAKHPLNAGKLFLWDPFTRLLKELFGQTIGEEMGGAGRK